jgi:hypothetical protein
VGQVRAILLGVLLTLLAPQVALAQVWTPKPPTSAPPDERTLQEARKRYQKGMDLYEQEGDIASALVELQRAYDLAPAPKILFNIGQVARSAREYVISLRAFEAYLQYGGKELTVERKTTVEGEIRTLRGLVSVLKVTTDRDGALILVDDLEMGVSPLPPFQVGAGVHRVVVQLGPATATRRITVAGGETATLDVPLGGESLPPPPPPPPPVESTRGGAPLYWIGWLATGGLAAGAVVTGSLALAQRSELDSQPYVGSEPDEDFKATESRAAALGITTDVLLGCAAVAAGFSIYFTVKNFAGSEAPTQPGPKVTFLPGGVMVSGAFE